MVLNELYGNMCECVRISVFEQQFWRGVIAMLKDILLADIIIEILDSSVIQHPCHIEHGLFQSNNEKIELLNAILIPHQKRYLSCVDSDARLKEETNVVSDYQTVFVDNGIDFVNESLVVSAFRFSVIDGWVDAGFREVCIALSENIKNCSVPEVTSSLGLKIIRRIISGSMYGMEPFDSNLRDDTLILRGLPESVSA